MAQRKTPEQQLAELKSKEAQLKARVQKKAAQIAKQKRKDDTRRKIVAGALALEHMDHDPAFAKAMMRLLVRHVKPADRHLFQLGDAPDKEPKALPSPPKKTTRDPAEDVATSGVAAVLGLGKGWRSKS